MTCHHIDWSGLEIKSDTRNGADNPTFKCLLCNVVMSHEEYQKVMITIGEKIEDNTLRFWRTPNGKEHTLEDCVKPDECFIHEGKEK